MMSESKFDRASVERCIHIAICDDEEKDRKKYEGMLQELARTHHVDTDIVCYESAGAFLFQLEDMEVFPDVIYMDIHMPKMDGIKLSRMLREGKQHVPFQGELIFLTYDKESFQDAFDVNAFHYVIKDVTPREKFGEIFLRVSERILAQRKKSLLIRGIGEYRNIAIDQIHYFEVYRRIISVHYGEPEERFEFYSSMNRLEEMTFPLGFLRVQRAFIVRVGAIHTLSKTKAVLQSGVEIPIGSAYYDKVRMAFENLKNR